MAACPNIGPVSNLRRRPLALTQRRLEANRRNAAHSTGPRTAAGKARVARNPIKHGFFVAPEKWTSEQRRDFDELLEGLREDFKPHDALEESCARTIARSYVRMASVLRYENIAAFEYHQRRDREMSERIAAADPAEAARLRNQRDKLRRAGLWRPTIPGPREAKAIIRYGGSLDRTIRHATSELQALRNMRIGGRSRISKMQKRCEASPNSVLRLGEGPRTPLSADLKVQKQTHFSASPRSGPEAAEGPQVPPTSSNETAKTNPLSSMFMGNRHERRRAKALAARRR